MFRGASLNGRRMPESVPLVNRYRQVRQSEPLHAPNETVHGECTRSPEASHLIIGNARAFIHRLQRVQKLITFL